MSERTNIEWADSTWSPWRGCTKVSSGCANCYAETMSHRNPAVFGEWGPGRPRVLNKDWNQVRRWNSTAEREGRRRRVFPSLCDWLDDEDPVEWLADFLRLIQETPNLDWLLLTKRPENWAGRIRSACSAMPDHSAALSWLASWRDAGEIPRNVWLGVSVEDQTRADERIPVLLQTPARVRFLSVEPLLGPVEICNGKRNRWSVPTSTDYQGNGIEWTDPGKGFVPVDWVIVGGESGREARPCDVWWVRDIVRQCGAAEVPCFVKQLGANPVGRWTPRPGAGLGEGWPAGMKIKDPKGGDPAEWPEDLRVRQMPEVRP